MSSSVPLAILIIASTAIAWLMTVPLHRFKEFRPKSRRDITAEVGTSSTPPQVVRATYRQAICPGCHHHLSERDVIPVVSWFRGCSSCGSKLPATVPMLQIGVPVAATITAITLLNFVEQWAVVIPFIWLVIILSAISVVDARILLIPYWMPWLGAGVGTVLIAASSLLLGKPVAVLYALGGGAALFAMFFILWLLAPAKLGFSDVRLAFLIGLFLGWLHPILPIYGLLFGSLLALVLGGVSIARRRDQHFAFGPALAMGTLCAVWLAGPILG